MYQINFSRRYRKAVKKLMYSGNYDHDETEKVLSLLSQGIDLSQNYRDHQLAGDMNIYRECHIKSDLLLFYEIDPVGMIITLIDIGSHSDLFG